MSASMSAVDWDERYAGRDLVWGGGPNVWVERETTDLPPGAVLDLACGEGRNSVWLAARGWRVTGVDFSAEAIRKAYQLSERTTITWLCADATSLDLPDSFDLAMMIYLQLPQPDRKAALTRAWDLLAPGGTLLVIAHDSRNLAEGVGGPQDPNTLYTARDVRRDIVAADPGAAIEKCEEVMRMVPDHDRPAIDALFRARKAA